MNKQSRTMSLIEAFANVAVGYGVAVGTQIVVFPLFGLETSLGANMMIGGVFTVVSIIRSFALRRLFEVLRVGRRRTAADLRGSSRKIRQVEADAESAFRPQAAGNKTNG